MQSKVWVYYEQTCTEVKQDDLAVLSVKIFTLWSLPLYTVIGRNNEFLQIIWNLPNLLSAMKGVCFESREQQES